MTSVVQVVASGAPRAVQEYDNLGGRVGLTPSQVPLAGQFG
jgi:hypothetical protein